MKKIALVLIAILALSSVALSGDQAKQGQWGVNSSVATGGAGAGMKFMLSDNMALRASVAFSSVSPGGGASSTSTYGIGAGFEYHMASVGGVSPYVGGQLGYASASAPNGGSAPSAFSIMGVYGGEYFFTSNFSLAGEIGLGFTSSTSGVSGAPTATAFGTSGVAGLTATWYLN